MSGKLYLCATPIGNLEDITFRVIRILNEVDLIAAEDTRHSIKLLNHYSIDTPMTSYHEHNKVEKAQTLVKKMQDGINIALITDAGMPGISDPGEEIVKQCYEAGIEVTILPGPCACVSALAISGQDTTRFCFEAFLPVNKKLRAKVLERLKNETRTIILYEAPHHLISTLEELQGVLGNRNISLCRELTKKYENVYRTDFQKAIEKYKKEEVRGEFVLVIEKKNYEDIEEEKRSDWLKMSISEHLEYYISKGIEKKEAMKAVAKDRGISKRDVYQEDVQNKGGI